MFGNVRLHNIDVRHTTVAYDITYLFSLYERKSEE